MDSKKILDATCGSRMMWFDKTNPLALFTDTRTESHILCDGRALEIRPDIEIDFTNMSFVDESFHLVVFDPPHLIKLGSKSWMAKKYGVLKSTWSDDIRKGVNECMRVLKPNGVLIFKWNEHQITLNQVLSVIDHKPLFGHTSAKHGKTIWMTFLKTESL
jgi:SAM-dependent methyltransferase